MSAVDALRRLPAIPGATGAAPLAPPPRDIDRGQQPAPFSDVLNRELAGAERLNFSAHAQARLLSRHIALSEPQLARLEQGVNDAARKGARDSLVMLDNLAFIVSVKNRTVVTAVDGAQSSGNVFTQIDSAVIV